MTDALRAKIGRLLAVGLPGPTLDADTQERLIDLRPGCVILFKRNVETPEQVRGLTHDLHALPGSPIVAIDQEGGRVARIKEPLTLLPPAADIGACGDVELAYQTGRILARELRSLGIDLNFAPVLDVLSHPDNDVIGDRAYGTTPEDVSAMALAVHRGMSDGGLISCGKHFPGHGGTVEDSHFDLPIDARPRTELEATDLLPFRAAIAANVPMLLTAHVIYPALDPNAPATLSRPVTQGLLREELGFEGVIGTDDMDMKAISDHHPAGEAAVLAVEAGCDMVLVCQALESAVESRDALVDAVERGRLAADTIDRSIERIEQLSQRREATPVETCEFPCDEHRALAARIGSRESRLG